MKKNILLIIIIALLCIGFVSAFRVMRPRMSTNVILEEPPAVLFAPVNSSINCTDADFNSNWYVDLIDFSMFASHYQEGDCTYPDWCDGFDLTQSGKVDLIDFAIFASWYGSICKKCNESDGGRTYDIWSRTDHWINGFHFSENDTCTDTDTLVEGYCVNRVYYEETVTCDVVVPGTHCTNGACIY